MEQTPTEIPRTIVADPPWQFRDSLPGPKRGAVKHYNLMSTADIMVYELPEMHKDSRLFLWRVASMQEDALQVMRAWGYEPKAEIVWLKKTRHGKRAFGMGHQVRNEHEVCLIGIKGHPMVHSRSIRSTFSVENPSWFDAKMGEHSEKPDEFYHIVKQLSPGPYVELFGRKKRRGWKVFGDEVEKKS